MHEPSSLLPFSAQSIKAREKSPKNSFQPSALSSFRQALPLLKRDQTDT